MNAVIHGHEETVALLADRGARLDVRDVVGKKVITIPTTPTLYLSLLYWCDGIRCSS